MEKEYFILAGIKKIGPLKKSELQRLYNDSKIESRDRVLDAQTKKWEFAKDLLSPPSLSNGSEVVSKMLESLETNEKSREPKEKNREPQKTEFVVSHEWYVQEGQIRLGPYSYFTMISMVLDGVLAEEQLVKPAKDKPFKPWPDYISDSEIRPYQKMLSTQTRFKRVEKSRRKTERLFFDEIFFIHDGEQEHIVKGYDVCKEGIAFFIINSVLSAQQKITCKIKLGADERSFYTGFILRAESIVENDNSPHLQKCVFLSDKPIDLSLVKK